MSTTASFRKKNRPSIKRTISSRSLKKSATTNINLDDAFAVGSDELLIEYHKVPWRLWINGAFHSLIEFQFFPLLLIIMSVIILIIFLFAEIYYAISPQCGLDLESLSDAWLFSVLIHFRSVFVPADPNNLFWNGCTEGVVTLFAQLFVGNILMSVLLSSLLFNFQSISRRSKSLFTTITIGQRLSADVDENKEPYISFPVVELNESEERKVTSVTVQVFVLDPSSSEGMKTLACNLALNSIETPQDVVVPLSGHANVNDCEICGKSFASKSALYKHLEACSDIPHISLLSRMKEDSLDQSELLRDLWSKDMEFIIVVEGADPITTDRVQVQRIFTSKSIVPASSRIPLISQSGTIDYKHFL